jgi:hypothetical protein
MNNAGDITGWTSDPQGIPGGFLRSHDGAFTEFQFFGDANIINSTGVIAGGTGHSTGFIRAPDGAVTTFGLPPTFNTLFVTGLNDSGNCGLVRVFLLVHSNAALFPNSDSFLFSLAYWQPHILLNRTPFHSGRGHQFIRPNHRNLLPTIYCAWFSA